MRAREAFVDVSSERAAQLEAELRSRPRQISPTPFVDFRAQYEGSQPIKERVGYARSTVSSAGPRDAVLLTGSDDTLRVWLNGELVLERLTARAAQPDDDRTPVKLRAGENTLLVEVGTGDGGWGFYLRLEEAGGAPYVVSDNGTLTPIRARGR